MKYTVEIEKKKKIRKNIFIYFVIELYRQSKYKYKINT